MGNCVSTFGPRIGEYIRRGFLLHKMCFLFACMHAFVYEMEMCSSVFWEYGDGYITEPFWFIFDVEKVCRSFDLDLIFLILQKDSDHKMLPLPLQRQIRTVEESLCLQKRITLKRMRMMRNTYVKSKHFAFYGFGELKRWLRIINTSSYFQKWMSDWRKVLLRFYWGNEKISSIHTWKCFMISH